MVDNNNLPSEKDLFMDKVYDTIAQFDDTVTTNYDKKHHQITVDDKKGNKVIIMIREIQEV